MLWTTAPSFPLSHLKPFRSPPLSLPLPLLSPLVSPPLSSLAHPSASSQPYPNPPSLVRLMPTPHAYYCCSHLYILRSLLLLSPWAPSHSVSLFGCYCVLPACAPQLCGTRLDQQARGLWGATCSQQWACLSFSRQDIAQR